MRGILHSAQEPANKDQPGSPAARQSSRDCAVAVCRSEASWREGSTGSGYDSFGDGEAEGGQPPSPRRHTRDGRTTEREGETYILEFVSICFFAHGIPSSQRYNKLPLCVKLYIRCLS